MPQRLLIFISSRADVPSKSTTARRPGFLTRFRGSPAGEFACNVADNSPRSDRPAGLHLRPRIPSDISTPSDTGRYW